MKYFQYFIDPYESKTAESIFANIINVVGDEAAFAERDELILILDICLMVMH